MRNKKFTLLYLTLILFIQCSKNNDSEIENISNASSYNNEILHLKRGHYEELKKRISYSFEKEDSILTKEVSQKIIPNKIESYKVSIERQILAQQNAIRNINELKNLKSLLSIYHDILSFQNNPEKMKTESLKYSDYMEYNDELKMVFLTISKQKAAMLNCKGMMWIDDELIVCKKNRIIVINNPKKNYTGQIENIIPSNDVRIYYLEDSNNLNKTRVQSNVSVHYHPQSNLYALGLIKFIDYESVYNGFQYIYVYSVGSEAATFFAGSSIFVNTFAITVVTSVPNTPPITTHSVKTLANLNNTNAVSETSIYSPFYSVSNNTGWYILYPNNVVFTGVY